MSDEDFKSLVKCKDYNVSRFRNGPAFFIAFSLVTLPTKVLDRSEHLKSSIKRNPSTGEDMMLKERKVVTFKCSSKLRKRVNSN